MIAKPSIEVLRKIKLFNGVTDGELAEIAQLCQEHSHEAGELCVSQGEKTDYVHFVKKGKVAIEFRIPHAPHGNNITVDILGEGEIFAWSALVSGTLTASVRATEPTRVLDVNAAELLALCEKKPHIGYVVMKNLTSVVSSRLTKSRLQLLQAVGAVIGGGW